MRVERGWRRVAVDPLDQTSVGLGEVSRESERVRGVEILLVAVGCITKVSIKGAVE
jgi:hypothetical protein